MSKCTPLHDIHVDLGATFTDFAGWQMPVRYSSETQEHVAVRTAAGLFDLCHMGEIEVVGPEAAAALDYALVGRPSQIGVGRARYTMLCDHDGGILDDLVVYRIADDHYLVVANASNASVVHGVVAERAKRYKTIVRNTSADWSLLAVQGPRSAQILDEVSNLAVSELKYYGIDAGEVAGAGAMIARTGYTGEDGFEIYCAPQDAPGVWRSLAEAGAELGLVPAGLSCRDTLRLEAGMPLYGQELSRTVTPFDAGLGRLVNFGRPEGFAGDAALARHRDVGSTVALVGLKASGRRVPRNGYDVLDPDSGALIGRITSGAPSPTLGYPIAMAYVPIAFEAPGTKVAVDLRGHREEAEVVSLPFYRRAGQQTPRSNHVQPREPEVHL